MRGIESLTVLMTPRTSHSTKVIVLVSALAAVVLAGVSSAVVSTAVAASLTASKMASSGGSGSGGSGSAGTAASGSGMSGSGMSGGSVSSGSSATASPITVNTAGFPTGGRNPGIFTDTCQLTKTLPNDPIMMPGMTGMSMQHDFFGNPAVDASSTSKQLVGGSTSCTTTADASAYWTPVLYQDGKPLTPRSTLIYWRAPAASASSVRTMPAGMQMIAGNEAATSSQSSRNYRLDLYSRPR